MKINLFSLGVTMDHHFNFTFNISKIYHFIYYHFIYEGIQPKYYFFLPFCDFDTPRTTHFNLRENGFQVLKNSVQYTLSMRHVSPKVYVLAIFSLNENQLISGWCGPILQEGGAWIKGSRPFIGSGFSLHSPKSK